MSVRRRGERLTDFIARLVAKRWDERVVERTTPRPGGAAPQRVAPHRPAHTSETPHAGPGVPGAQAAGRAGDQQPEATSPLTLERVEDVITRSLGYEVQRHLEDGRTSLVGLWGSYPFVFEIPEGHEGWLLIAGDWEEPAGPATRDELAAAINDWNRDKLFPTVTINDAPGGPFVRATYLVDLAAGVTSDQLRLHVDTALFSCTQALSRIRPLLPEL
ncbi:MAG: YbjN domain-containing protein [Actinomyces sp.]|uniref:YbjN domain-containing protein n=1 Tax=Actinomyces sp. TaxID=29317 RepID=UPI0026DA7186|nr:YbjN domain-containing protein [Actinomyces sp.]MDO4242693.1 YbjN domain-containing protein [Actinomyces sp.]